MKKQVSINDFANKNTNLSIVGVWDGPFLQLKEFIIITILKDNSPKCWKSPSHVGSDCSRNRCLLGALYEASLAN